MVVSPAHRSVQFRAANQAGASVRGEPEPPLSSVVMEHNARFPLRLHLLMAALAPLVLGKSRGGVRGWSAGRR